MCLECCEVEFRDVVFYPTVVVEDPLLRLTSEGDVRCDGSAVFEALALCGQEEAAGVHEEDCAEACLAWVLTAHRLCGRHFVLVNDFW